METRIDRPGLRKHEIRVRGRKSGLSAPIDRRGLLKLAGSVLVGASNFSRAPAGALPTRAQTGVAKRVIVAGGGIAGLSCAYELMKRGHEVTVLEASGRTGGHVRTLHDPFVDGLYLDVGAENFNKPGYDLFWGYVEEFQLTPIYYPQAEIALRFINGKAYTPEMLHDRTVLEKLGFNPRERDFLARQPWWNLLMLYFDPYAEKFKDEYKPFEAGLDDLDRMIVPDLLKKDGASPAAIAHIGDSDSSALHAVWRAAILKLRGVPLAPPNYRLKGGNRMMTDAFTSKLGERIRLGCPVTGIEHGEAGVTVRYNEFGNAEKVEGDYLVCCLSAPMLSQLAVTPNLPPAKAYAIRNVPYYTRARVAFQSRTPFWEKDRVSPSIEFGERSLRGVWRMADDVRTARGFLAGYAEPGTRAEQALATFRKFYPGKSEDIEQAFVYDWSLDPWCTFCETIGMKPGELKKIWPTVIEPCGRIHFAGAYADNFGWGMEAATRSAHRVAKAIDQA